MDELFLFVPFSLRNASKKLACNGWKIPTFSRNMDNGVACKNKYDNGQTKLGHETPLPKNYNSTCFCLGLGLKCVGIGYRAQALICKKFGGQSLRTDSKLMLLQFFFPLCTPSFTSHSLFVIFCLFSSPLSQCYEFHHENQRLTHFLEFSYLKKNEIRDMYSLKENQNLKKNSLAKMLVLTIQKLETNHTLKLE